VPTFDDRGCHVVSVIDPYCRILGFLNRPVCSHKRKIKTFKIIVLLVVLYECKTWSLILSDEHTSKAFEKKRVKGAKRQRVEKTA
jgi:hypothetical protein